MEDGNQENPSVNNTANKAELEFWMQELQGRIPFSLTEYQQTLLRTFLEDVLAPVQPIAPPGFHRRSTILTLDLTEAQQAEVLCSGQYQGGNYDLTRWNIAKKLSGKSAENKFGEHDFIVEPMIIHRIHKMF